MVATVLVTDDDRDALESTAMLLEAADYRVVRAYTAREALDVLDDHGDIDVVVSDIRMPDIDGFDFLRVVKARFPAIPIVLVTGMPISRDDVVPAGACILQKPFGFDELQQAITEELEKKQARRPQG